MYVEGRLSSRSYQTQGGETRFVNEINLTDVQFLGRASGDQDREPVSVGGHGAELDDLPF